MSGLKQGDVEYIRLIHRPAVIELAKDMVCKESYALAYTLLYFREKKEPSIADVVSLEPYLNLECMGENNERRR